MKVLLSETETAILTIAHGNIFLASHLHLICHGYHITHLYIWKKRTRMIGMNNSCTWMTWCMFLQLLLLQLYIYIYIVTFITFLHMILYNMHTVHTRTYIYIYNIIYTYIYIYTVFPHWHRGLCFWSAVAVMPSRSLLISPRQGPRQQNWCS